MCRTYNNTVRDKDGPVTTLYNFRRDAKSKLLFFRDDEKERLCIPRRSLKALLKMAHDSITHIGVERVFQVLRQHVFFPRMKKEILKYASHYLVCSQAKPSRIRPWGSLQPIEYPKIPLSVLCLDFVDGLPISKNGNDKALLITDKCSKFIRYLIGKKTNSAEMWADRYFEHIFRD
jgi:hypothetical protein